MKNFRGAGSGYVSRIEQMKLYAQHFSLKERNNFSSYIHIADSYYLCISRGSSVGLATGYGLDDGGVGVRVPIGSRMFTSTYRPDWLWPLVQWIVGLFSREVKR
jgi:hypothetical protein